MDEYVYDAFISYSHKDIKWARWLQRRLESFRIPRKAEMERSGKEKLRIFRDQTDLAGTELQAALEKEMRASRYLILICSPRSAASRWVNEEAEFFASLGRGDRIIPFIIDGEPESDSSELECFPPALRKDGPTEELLGISVHEIGKRKAFLKVTSVLLGMRFNRLADREKKSRILRTTGITAVAVIAVAVTGYLLLQNYEITKKNQEIEQENRELSYDAFAKAYIHMDKIENAGEIIDAEMLSLFEQSVEAGNVDVMVLLGDCYKLGVGTEKNEIEGFSWYLRAAEGGSPEGMLAAGSCMFNGIGTEVDIPGAAEWFRKAAEAGNLDGICLLANCYFFGDGVEQDQTKAVALFKEAAEAGDRQSMSTLAVCYHNGWGTERNDSEAFKWQLQLAQLGDVVGMTEVGAMYRDGIGVEIDPRQAYLWFRKAAENGYKPAMIETAKCIENGVGVENVAQDWYERAFIGYLEEAETGNYEAMVPLGVMYIEGKGVQQDLQKAFEWFMKATERPVVPYTNAMALVAMCFEEGYGTEQDLDAALEWYERAAEGENSDGIEGAERVRKKLLLLQQENGDIQKEEGE